MKSFTSDKKRGKNDGSHGFMARYCGALQNLFWSLNKGWPSLRLRCSLWPFPCLFFVVLTTRLLLQPFQNRGKEKFRRSLPYRVFHFFLFFFFLKRLIQTWKSLAFLEEKCFSSLSNSHVPFSSMFGPRIRWVFSLALRPFCVQRWSSKMV